MVSPSARAAAAISARCSGVTRTLMSTRLLVMVGSLPVRLRGARACPRECVIQRSGTLKQAHQFVPFAPPLGLTRTGQLGLERGNLGFDVGGFLEFSGHDSCTSVVV